VNDKLFKIRMEFLRRVTVALEMDPTAEVISVIRLKGDGGTLVVDGERMQSLFRDPCPFCRQVGHVFYPGSDIISEMQFHNGQKRSNGKWYQHASAGLGDAIIECAWCGASAAQWEFWGIKETEKRVEQFRKDYPKKHGYRVRIEARK
jgi:hypothetical protein